ncbi:thioredoxin 1 [Actinopolymorpha cephalotaxi]|uniref:Thioredoxin n=1 Tax=Actinopolymorpha cephalotaxi TaxID=504797 RepID=A0A1I2RGZ1_9ACTN|nr:thioredoxin [Actinopolymorpha cephalotaxi]NYH82231.1 thioredoxin 1 [Actinopolymorpha cephalotaxi]SFG39848.1 thioredoxin 1 [Actinopolymorpha cephalotaxi]
MLLNDKAARTSRPGQGKELEAVTDATFADRVLGADLPVLVEFWAPWCGPCRMLGPVLEQIAGENAERLRVVKINYDENPQTGMATRVMAVPTMQVYRGGELVKSLVGARSKARLLAELEDVLAPA